MIEHVSIRNFKSIRAVDVNLSPVTVFIGRSGTGKSNFLRAIRFLRNYLSFGDAAVGWEGGWERIYPNGVPSSLSLTVRFRLPGFEQPFFYELGWKSQQNHQPRLDHEILKVGDRTVLQWQQNQWLEWPGEGSKPTNFQPRVYLNQFPILTEAVLTFAAWTTGIGWHDFPSTVFAQGSQQRSGGGQGLDDNGSNYLTVIRDQTQDLRDQSPRRQILARLKQVNSTISSVELDSIQQPSQVIVAHRFEGQKVALNLSQESDGFRRYYAHLLALYQIPPKLVLMFEEPENGVYPGALLNLAEEFEAAPAAKRGQVLLSTQSPALLEGFEPEQIRVVDLDPVTQQTRIGSLDADQVEAVKAQLLEPGELLTVDQARIAK